MIGTTVGSYRITHKVSVGGMGTVYKAEHTLIGKLAAVKVLHPELRNNREVVNRFFNEAKATTQIKHPGIVEIFDFGYLPSGDGYIVMEFLSGASLARRMRKGKMPEGKAAVLLKQVCSALAAAHAKHIVHRDLKPDNIFLCPDPDQPSGERPKLLDFGIAKLSDVGLMGSGSATKTGAVMGTPTYMAPEQCSGAGLIDHRADLYALGCIFYELVCGVPPFEAEGAGALLGMHLYVEPAPPTSHEPSLTAAAESLILGLLDKKPDNRPQTAVELGNRLAIIAQAAGWLGDKAPNVVAPEIDEPEEPLPEDPPEVAPDLSSHVATGPKDVPAAAVPRDPGPLPTTLSSAASQSLVDLPPRRSYRWIGAVGLAVVAAGAFVVVMSSGSGNKATPDGGNAKPAAQPATAAPAAAQPTPPPSTASLPGTAVAPPRPGKSAEPTDISPGEVAANPEPPASTGKTPQAQASDPEPKTTPPRTTVPTRSTTGKTTSVKPNTTRSNDAGSRTRGSKTGSGSSTKILIETDL
jgi:serine/threonine-protein kinase